MVKEPLFPDLTEISPQTSPNDIIHLAAGELVLNNECFAGNGVH